MKHLSFLLACAAGCFFTSIAGVSAQTSALTIIHRFGVNGEGLLPQRGVIEGTDGNFYGATQNGGAYARGTVYKVTPTGTLTTLHDFTYDDGAYPVIGLVQGSNGNFYGITSQGGTNGYGTFFQVTPTGVFTVLRQLTYSDTGYSYYSSASNLILASDGNFYGTSSNGGANNNGSVFQVTPAGVFTSIHSFSAPNGSGAFSEGTEPSGPVVQGVDGNLYGVTQYGGANDYGTVFSLTTSGSLTTLHSFSAPVSGVYSEGVTPIGGLTLGNDGNFYGSTEYGGANDDGSIFSITSSGTITTLHSLTYSEGDQPITRLALGADGLFYGIAAYGGVNGDGTFFKINSAGSLTVLHSFSANEAIGGLSAPIAASNGNFYATDAGSTSSSNYGGVLTLSSSGAVTPLHLFSYSDGISPQSGLTLGVDGNLYGVTTAGGTNGVGTFFSVSPSGVLTTLHSFISTEGSSPSATLIQGADAAFYGTASGGGANFDGTVYKLTASGVLSVLHSFNYADGDDPLGGLAQGSDGNFYGTTYNGGANGDGAIFEVTPAGGFSLLHSFVIAEGSNPQGKLALGTDGNFYGTASSGGSSGYGTIFLLNSADSVITLHAFTDGDGSAPRAGVLLSSDGNFYGTTASGGSSHDGTVFQLTPEGALTTQHSFTYSYYGEGYSPAAGLIEGTDGVLYGTTQYGASSNGTVFAIIPGGLLTTLHSFGATEGSNPAAGLLQRADGSLVGTTSSDTNSRGFGTVFALIPTPIFTSPSSAYGILSQAFSYQIAATGSPTSLGASNLPGGLSVNSSGLISGTPTQTGTFSVSLSATNSLGTSTAILPLIVATNLAPPQITSESSVQGYSGLPFSYRITASNSPTSFSATGLPSGLTLNTATGLISGSSTAQGSYDVTIAATNAAGTGNSPLALTIAAAPTPTPTPPPNVTPSPTPTPTPTPTPVPPAPITVDLTSPPAGVTLDAGADLTFAATLTDPDHALSKLTFYVNNVVASVAPVGGPYVYNGTAPAPGVYQLSVVSIDSLGRQSTSARTLNVQAPANPSAPPAVGQIITNLNDHSFAEGALVPVTATFTAPGAGDEIVQVEFLSDDQIFASLDGAGNPIKPSGANSEPSPKDASIGAAGLTYTASVTMPGGNKLVNIVALALTKLGHTQISNAVTPTGVSPGANHPPSLKVASPTVNFRVRVGATTSVPVTVSDPDDPNAPSAHKRSPIKRVDLNLGGLIAKLEYYLNAVKVKDSPDAPYGYEINPPSAGVYVLSAIATDGAGLSTVSAPVVVQAFVAPNVSVTVKGNTSISEDGGRAKVVISRDGSDLSQPLTVNYKLQGAAANGSDYAKLGNSAVIPAGQASVAIKVKAIDNSTKDGSRSMTLKLVASQTGDYEVGSPKKVTVSIVDND